MLRVWTLYAVNILMPDEVYIHKYIESWFGIHSSLKTVSLPFMNEFGQKSLDLKEECPSVTGGVCAQDKIN